jgi:hypothetical protein
LSPIYPYEGEILIIPFAGGAVVLNRYVADPLISGSEVKVISTVIL